jgi:hypothetical protein
MGHQLTTREVEAQYEAIQYNSADVTPHAVFTGFRFMQLHKNLLRHWYYNGLLTTAGIVYQLCYGLRYRVEMTLTSHMCDTYKRWVTWAVTVMQVVEELLEAMKTNVLVDYMVEDCNRVALLVWEEALIFMDAIDGLSLPDTALLSSNLAYVYIRYHTTLSYPSAVSIDELFATTLEWSEDDNDNEFVRIATLLPTSIIAMSQSQSQSQFQPQPQPIQPQLQSQSHSQPQPDSQHIMVVAMQKLTEQMQTMQEEMKQMNVSLVAKDEEIARLSIPPMPVQAEAEYVDRSSKVADQFAQSLKTDSQVSLLNDVTHITYPVLLSSAVPAQASLVSTRRITPTHVSIAQKDLREYFPPAVHAYFTSDGRHDLTWPEFVTNFINMFIYKKCYCYANHKNLDPSRVYTNVSQGTQEVAG